jgi:Lecithin retinol acyltransferase
MELQPVQHTLNPRAFHAIFPTAHPLPFGDGIYLLRQKSVKYGGIHHYGFAVTGNYLPYFGFFEGVNKVIHKTNEGVFEENYDPYEWEILGRMQSNELAVVVKRVQMSLNDAYDLLSNNCEHFARFVVTGKKESSQIQGAVGWGILGVVTYLWLREDN